jgi:hypothetical protein
MRSWLGIVTAAALMVGGGTAIASGAAASATPQQVHQASTSPRAKAQALAAKLVAEMTFPAGTKTAPLSSTPSALRSNPYGGHWTSAERLLVAPVKPAAVWAVLLSHRPFDETGASMGTAASNGPVGTTALLPAPEPGISAAEADVTLEPWHNGSTLIAAYGFATWLPVRSAAEHVNPASIWSVTVTANDAVASQRTVTRTYTSAAIISRIAAFLNSRPAAPELAIPCPMAPVAYQATFTPKAKDGPKLTASSTGCLTDQVTVNGVSQPQLWDEPDAFGKLISKLPGFGTGSQ